MESEDWKDFQPIWNKQKIFYTGLFWLLEHFQHSRIEQVQQVDICIFEMVT